MTGEFHSEGFPATLKVPYKNGSEWQTFYRNIASHVRSGAELMVKPEQARRVIAVLEGAEKSSELKRSVEVPTEDEDAK